MPCTYCQKTGHNRKTCPDYLSTISADLMCPNCQCSFTDNPFAMLNCGHPMCLSCVMNMGSVSNNHCVDCAKEAIIPNEIITTNDYTDISPPNSPSNSTDLIEVNHQGVMYCKKTNTYVYDKVRFNTLRAAINCRKTHILLGKKTVSLGKGIYLYDGRNFNSLEILRRAQCSDMIKHLSSNPINPEVIDCST